MLKRDPGFPDRFWPVQVFIRNIAEDLARIVVQAAASNVNVMSARDLDERVSEGLHQQVGVCCPNEVAGLVEFCRVFPHDDCVRHHTGYINTLQE